MPTGLTEPAGGCRPPGGPPGPLVPRGTTMRPMEFLGRLYARRIVNVNVNVVAAGSLAMGLTLIPVYLTRLVGIHEKWKIVAVTLSCDIVFDVGIYYFLHWLANHWQAFPWIKHRKRHPAGHSFIRDASLVQFERALLAPIYYGVALGVQYTMLHHLNDGADRRELATVVGLGGGLLITRAVHTAWMLWSERRWKRRATSSAPPAACEICTDCGHAVPLGEAACPLCGLAHAGTARRP